ncbi:MAG: SRPBCC family protein, partial [Gemmataceae bacterium]|nr:SRPBCC family protein [Gemmataceae bacterium]
MSAPPPATVPQLRRRRWWLVIPLALVAVLAAGFFYFYLRGSWAAEQGRDPATSAEGVVAQLVKTDDGPAVRCAVVIDHPLEKVWPLLTDFEHYGEVFSTLAEAEGGTNKDGTGWLKGVAQGSAFVGSWPIMLVLRPGKDGDKRLLSWDSPLDDLKECKGRFVLAPLDKGRTLATYTLRVRTGRYPVWLT